jgi:hypothetical protein
MASCAVKSDKFDCAARQKTPPKNSTERRNYLGRLQFTLFHTELAAHGGLRVHALFDAALELV